MQWEALSHNGMMSMGMCKRSSFIHGQLVHESLEQDRSLADLCMLLLLSGLQRKKERKITPVGVREGDLLQVACLV